MPQLLIYANSNEGVAFVVDSSEDGLFDLYGHDISNWPDDFRIFDRGDGLYVWEGDITEDEGTTHKFVGNLRSLLPTELRILKNNGSIIGH